MAFPTDAQFDRRLRSPNFRSMRPNPQSGSPLSGLLSVPEPPPGPAADSLAGGGPGPAYGGQENAVPTPPSPNQMLTRPAQTQYAKATPPAQSRQSVWNAPSSSNLRYPDSVMNLPSTSVTAGLLDDTGSIAQGLGGMAMTMPQGQPQQLDLSMLTAPPPPESDILFPQGDPLAVRPPDYLQPIQYSPLAPSRRYEVL